MAKASNTAQQSADPIGNSAHFTLQGKGGCGKSFVSTNLAQYFRSRSNKGKNVDTDPLNPTFSGFKDLDVQYLKILDSNNKIDERNFDQLMERVMTEDGTFVVDNGSSSFVPLSNYMIENNAYEMMKDAGRQVYIHTVVAGGQALPETLRGFANLAEQSREQNIVVWVNEFYGDVISEDGRSFTEMKAYQSFSDKVKGIVRLPRRNPDTFGKDIQILLNKRLTFDEAIGGTEFSLMAKQRIKTVQREVFEQLDKVGL